MTGSGKVTVKCNICKCTEFEDFRGRPRARCTQCGALERTRLLAMHLEQLTLPPAARILHVAPEESISRMMCSLHDVAEYTAADFDPEAYAFTDCRKIDLCDLEHWPSNHFDLVLHSHVLEHTKCNIAYSLFHIHRMLKPGGRHVFLLPFTSGHFEESFEEISPGERQRRFGQWDHVRKFGVDDIENHLGKILTLPETVDAEACYGRSVLEGAAIPERLWNGLHGSSVIDVGKDDYRLR
jgi:hypothetical protein